MSPLVFVDVLAYAGAALGALFMFLLGLLLMRSSNAVLLLSALIGNQRAKECVHEGSFDTKRMRACGGLFLLFACFISLCIIRSFHHQ